MEIFEEYGLNRAALEPMFVHFRQAPQKFVDFMMRFELNLEEPDPNRSLVRIIFPEDRSFTVILTCLLPDHEDLCSYHWIVLFVWWSNPANPIHASDQHNRCHALFSHCYIAYTFYLWLC